MSFLAGSIVGKLDLDTGGFTGGFLKAQSIISTFPQLVTDFLADPLLGFLDLTKDVMEGVAQTLETGFDLVKSSFEHSLKEGDQLATLAANAGVSASALSGLSRVAMENGASMQSVADAYKFLGRNMADAADGGKDQIAAFNALGVATQDAAGNSRPLADVMMDVADGIKNIQDPAERTKLAMDLLGRGGVDMIGTLRQGSAAIREHAEGYAALGGVISDAAAQSSHAYSIVTDQLEAYKDGLQESLSSPIREALTPVLQSIVAWLKANGPQINAFVGQIGTDIGDGITGIAGFVSANLPQIKEVVSTVGSEIKSVVTTVYQAVSTHIPEIIALINGGVTLVGTISEVVVDIGADIVKAILYLFKTFSDTLLVGWQLLEKIPLIGSLFSGGVAAQADVSAFAQAGIDAANAFQGTFKSGMDNFQQSFNNFASHAAVNASNPATQPAGAAGSSSGGNTYNMTMNLPRDPTPSELTRVIDKAMQQARREAAARQAAAAKSVAIRAGL